MDAEPQQRQVIGASAGARPAPWVRFLAGACLAVLLLLGASGCLDPSEEMEVWNFLMEYGQTTGTALNNSDNSPNPAGVIKAAKQGMGISTGDEVTDATLDADTAIQAIREAEILMGKARRERDVKSMDDALRLRPNDYTYLLARAALALEQGDLGGYDRFGSQAGTAFQAVKRTGMKPVLDQVIAELEVVNTNLGGRYRVSTQCARLLDDLASAYEARAVESSSSADRDKAATARNLRQSCPG